MISCLIEEYTLRKMPIKINPAINSIHSERVSFKKCSESQNYIIDGDRF
jgi:hypothetical protein